jgi:hypothetical protein
LVVDSSSGSQNGPFEFAISIALVGYLVICAPGLEMDLI